MSIPRKIIPVRLMLAALPMLLTSLDAWSCGDGGESSRADLSSLNPVAGMETARTITSVQSSANGMRKLHSAIEYAVAQGSNVVAVASGTIEFAGHLPQYGNAVIVTGSENAKDLYATLARIDVKTGDCVSNGQIIGSVGEGPWRNGPVLHFEASDDGQFQYPVDLNSQKSK